MKEINNLIYKLEMNFINNQGANVSVVVEFHDNGLEMKSIRVGDVCITEETINGKVLSGKLENLDGYCGYRYDYEKGGYLLNLNPQIPIDITIDSINKRKMEHDYLSAKMVLGSILKNDYKVVALEGGSLNITKTISAQDKQSEIYSLQENSNLLKVNFEEGFIEQDKKLFYKKGDNSVAEDDIKLAGGNIEFYFIELSTILSKNPKNYEDLIELRNQIQKSSVGDSVNEVKVL